MAEACKRDGKEKDLAAAAGAVKAALDSKAEEHAAMSEELVGSLAQPITCAGRIY